MGDIDTKLILAPMAGFTDQPFRRLARGFGADEVVTELVSANALVRNNPKTQEMTQLHDGEKPASIQIFGAEPYLMAEAARMLDSTGCLFIDINMGCPAKKITKNGAGAALLGDPQAAALIMKEVVEAVKTPVSIKIRTGRNAKSKTGMEIAKLAVDCGVSRITVHARTVADGFSGEIDYEFVKELKQQCPSVEVIGNGGIFCYEDAVKWIERTGCDGLMIGSGALGHPSIFQCIKRGESRPQVEEVETIVRHITWMNEYYCGDRRTVFPMRGHLMYYSRGLEAARRFRTEVNSTRSMEDIENIVREYFEKPKAYAV